MELAKVGYMESGWIGMHASFPAFESLHGACVVLTACLHCKWQKLNLTLVWARRCEVTEAQRPFLLQVGRGSLGSPCCPFCACWWPFGSALHRLHWQLGSPVASGASLRLAVDVVRKLLPKMLSWSPGVESPWPGFSTRPSLSQSQVWAIEYFDCRHHSHVTTLGVGVGSGSTSEFCPNVMAWEEWMFLQSKTRSLVSKGRKTRAGQAEPTTAPRIGLRSFSTWSCFFFFPLPPKEVTLCHVVLPPKNPSLMS